MMASHSAGAAVATRGVVTQVDRGRGSDECSRLPPSVWPSGSIARRLHIARLQLARISCIDNPDYLAALGGLILDDGDAEQALIWLERALLLDPDNRGAQADHALALAALGQPDALQDLRTRWQGRSDLPAALRSKLFPEGERSAYSFPAVKLGRLNEPSWGTQGEVSLQLGRESNLDRTPRLTELTLTLPGEEAQLFPVISQPRSGTAALANGAFQIAYSPAANTILRTGLNLSSRSATRWPNTNWHQTQWAASASRQWSALRGQLELSATWLGGPLSEAFRLDRTVASVDLQIADCKARTSFEAERRKQSRTLSFNSRASGSQASLQCPLPLVSSWSATLFLRTGRDSPDSADRPGGVQRQSGLGLRLLGELQGGTRVDLAVRQNRFRDAEGYNPLLEDNAIRRLSLRQYLLEIAQPLERWGWAGLELSLQVQSARQDSNLALFNFRADSWYGGLRWSW